MGDRSGQGEDMEQSRDASWRQWQCQQQRYLVFARGIRAFKRTETEQIFVLEDAHSPSICPLLQVQTSLQEEAPQAPDQPLSGDMVWRDHSGLKSSCTSTQTQGLHQRTPQHMRATGVGESMGWFSTTHPCTLVRVGPSRFPSRFPSLVGRASDQAGHDALGTHTVFFFEAYEHLSVS